MVCFWILTVAFSTNFSPNTQQGAALQLSCAVKKHLMARQTPKKFPAINQLYNRSNLIGINPILMREETGVDYALHPIDISGDRQKSDPAYLTVNPICSTP